MKRMCVVSLVVLASGCSGGSLFQPSSSAPAVNTQSAAEIPSSDEIAQAFARGDLRFEVRGLKNVASPSSTGGASYSHRGVVILTGKPELTRLPYMMLFSVKRVGGGDPNALRGADSRVFVYLIDGIGDLDVYSGYRTSSEKWDAEQIELTPVAIMPAIPVRGEVVKEQ